MAELVILSNKQLRDLATLILNQENLQIQNIDFQSELDRTNFLQACMANYNCIVGYLDTGVQLTQKYVDDKIKAPIASDIHDYIINSANSALQIIRNYTVRTDYLKKISEHVDSLVNGLETLDPNDVTKVKELADAVTDYQKAMFEYTKFYQTVSTEAFSKSINEEGLTFEELIAKYQKEAGYDGKPFKELEDTDKLEVLLKIMELAVPDGGVSVYKLTAKYGVGGPAVFVFLIGRLVWDVFSGDHNITEATRDAIVSAAKVGGTILSNVIKAAVKTALTEIEASTVFVTMAGLATGFLGTFLISEAAGLLFDKIIGTGGEDISVTDGYKVFVAEMPDGQALAYQIAHG